MKKIFSVAAIVALAFLVSCSGNNTKKVLIMSSGKLNIDPKNQSNIKQEPGTQHNEAFVTFNTKDKVLLNVETPTGKKTFDIEAPGFYLLNLKVDTLVGGFKNFGVGPGETKITQEQLHEMIDSLNQLIVGQGVSEAKRNFFIVPDKLQKLSDNINSQVFGPYNQMPSSFSTTDDKVPEVYKFYTVPDAREIITSKVELLKQ